MSTAGFQSLLTSTAAPAFMTNSKGQVMGLNSAGEALLGYGSASVRGLRCREVFAGRDRFGNCFCLERCAVREMAARNEAVNPFEVRLKTASGTMLDVSVAVVAMRDQGRSRPAILHLIRPTERAVHEKNGDGSGFETLTRREQEVLTLLARGVNCHDMARATGISLTTVRNHLKRIFPKLKVHSQAEAVSLAFRNRMVSLLGLFLVITSEGFLDQVDVACAAGVLLT